MERFIVCRDDQHYQAFPDVTLTASGKLICVFLQLPDHLDRSETQVMICQSTDRGRTWTAKRPLSERLRSEPGLGPSWNCPRVVTLSDGRLAATVDSFIWPGVDAHNHWDAAEQRVWLWLSRDEGATWDGPTLTPACGIVPDKLRELRHGPRAGRWLLATHTAQPDGLWLVRAWLSDDQGCHWQGPIPIAATPGLRLCEPCLVELPDGALMCLMRENSGKGWDAYKCLSMDGGETWTGPIAFPLPGCHRPVAGLLRSGRVLITYRFMQGGQGFLGWWTQNFFAALTDVESCLAPTREGAHTRIRPIDFDRSPRSDVGYSGWAQFPDGEIYIVYYIVDDAPKAHIRACALREDDFVLT